MLATFRLFVITRKPRCRFSARATSSVVVPRLMKSEAWSGICDATNAPIRRFSSWNMRWRAVYDTFSALVGRLAPP